MADNDIKIDVVVSTDNAARQFDKLDNELKDVKRSTDNLSGGFSSLEKKLITAGSALNLASAAAGLVADGLKAIPEAVKKGADIDDVSDSFNKLATSAGTTAKTLLNQLNSATLDTVSNLELMTKANENLRAGFKPDELITFTKAAKILSDQTGSDLIQTFDNLTQAFRTGRVAAVQSALGLISVEQAGSKLDTALASRATLFEIVTGVVEKYGIATKDAGDYVKGLNKTFEDTKNQIYQSIAGNQELNNSLRNLADTLKSTDFSPLISGINTFVSATAGAIDHATKLGELIKTLFSGGSVPLPQLDSIFGGDSFSKLANSKGTINAPDLSNSVFNSALNFASTINNSKKAGVKQSLDITTVAANKLNEELAKAKLEIDKLVGFDAYPKLTSEVNAAMVAFKDNAPNELSAALNKIAEEALRAGQPISAVTDAIQNFQEKAKEAAKEQSFGDSLIQSLFGIGKSGKNDQIAASVANSISGLFNDALSLVTTAINGGNIGVKDVFAAIDTAIGGVAGGIVGGPAGAAIGSQLGNVVGTLIGSMFEHTETAGTQARKAADKYFADVFDENRLSVVIKGQLVKINDLVFKGESLFNKNSDFGSGSFSDYFKTLSKDAQQAFDGVGRAFEELIGNSEDFAGQLGAIFANNIGGNLNNLQLLVQATGKSFDDLGKAIEKSFEKGNLSAVQAQQAFNQLAQLSKPGIPGQKGAANTAFKNLLSAGAKGGNATLDALKDIGAEGLEAGITSTSGLKRLFNSYVANGQFTKKQVDTLFKALQNLNITSVSQLANAGNNTLISLAAQLESSGVLKVIDGVVEQLTKLPSEKTINVKVNTQFTGDRNAARVASLSTDATRSGAVSAR